VPGKNVLPLAGKQLPSPDRPRTRDRTPTPEVLLVASPNPAVDRTVVRVGSNRHRVWGSGVVSFSSRELVSELVASARSVRVGRAVVGRSQAICPQMAEIMCASAAKGTGYGGQEVEVGPKDAS
jgi:hypothetical protein